MSTVSVYNEWDPLEEVIVGTAVNARVPTIDRSVRAIEPDLADSRPGPFPAHVIAESEQALDELANVLTAHGVRVRRPAPHTASRVATHYWETTGLYNYCPRDVLLAVGNTVIEAPMVLRARSIESDAYKEILIDYLRSGCRWIAAPKPRLADEMYNLEDSSQDSLRNLEPAFDAANVLRVGRDILYQVSRSGNELGAIWLQSVLGPEYRVEPLRNLYNDVHIDTTICVLRPGLVMLNPKRVTENNIPNFFKGWDVIWCPDPIDTGPAGGLNSEKWIFMNLLMINPELAIVDAAQRELIALLKAKGIDSVPLTLPHSRLLGGGFHCVTLDVRRRGVLEDYRA